MVGAVSRVLSFACLPLALLFVACSSADGSSATGAPPSGGSSNDDAVPRGAADVSLSGCPKAGQLLTVGRMSPLTTIESGQADERGRATIVTCNIVGGHVHGLIQSVPVGSLMLDATLDASGASSAATIEASAVTAEAMWSSASCTLAPLSNSATSYRASFHCAGATNPGEDTCDVTGEIDLEQCAQQ